MKLNYFKPLLFVFLSLSLWSCSVGVATITPSGEMEVVSMDEFEAEQRKKELERYKELYDATGSYKYREQLFRKYNFKENDGIGSAVDYGSLAENELAKPAQGNSGLATVKYRRSSLYTLMLTDSTSPYYYLNKFVFTGTQIPEKFNDHNLGPYEISRNPGSQNQLQNITEHLNKNDVAKHMVARWFNRGTDGGFNMDLVARRGEYNASDLDIKIALQTVRGKALLKDAGEELIGNSFVVVYDFEDIDNERKTGFLSYSLKSNIRVRAYLFRLVWDDATAGTFYNEYWMDENTLDNSRKKAFDQSDIFKLKYIGSVVVDESSKAGVIKTSKRQLEDMEKGDWSSTGLGADGIALKDAMNACLNDLQRNYEEFRTKFPLFSGDPIAAKVGKKEGIKEGDKFEVLEQVLNEDGTTEYHQLGIIKVAKEEDIWDNTKFGDWFGSTSKAEYTVFQGPKGKYSTGMLIRQIN